MIKASLLCIQYLWHNFLLTYSYRNSVSIKSCRVFAKFARRKRSSMNEDFACQKCLLIDELNFLHFSLEMLRMRTRCHRRKKTSKFHCHSKISRIRQRLNSVRIQYICRLIFAIIIKAIFFNRTMLEAILESFWIVYIH
jgi:hypothetical protein